MNRYSISASADQIAHRFSVEVSPGYRPNYNAGPAHLLPVITNTGPQGVSFFYWGLAPDWAKNKPISEKFIQVNTDALATKPVYRKVVSERRCIIPADGFYGWKKVGKKTSIPYRFTLKQKELFAMAGLWEEYEDEDEKSFHTFTLITCPPNELVAPASDRMPVILTPETEKMWLDHTIPESDRLAMLKIIPANLMDCYTISARINSVFNNDASLILPAPASDQFGNLTLFDF